MRSKLGIKLGDEGLAAKLYAAGITNPAKLRAASDEGLRDAGLKAADLAKVRAKFRRRQG